MSPGGGIARGFHTVQTADCGLGTTFERYAIYRWLEDVAERYSIRTVLEGPGDGVAGIPGIHSIPMAQKGCETTIVLGDLKSLAQARRAWAAQECSGNFICVQEVPLPFPDHSFDLVWNFNRLPFVGTESLVSEMTRLSRRYVALVVPNRRSYGFLARRLYHRHTGEPWIYGDTTVMALGPVRRILERAGLNIVETRWVDVPWWPDIIDPVAWLRAMIPAVGHLFSTDRKTSDGYRWEPDALPYFASTGYDDVHRRMRRLGWMERSWPALMQMPFAHHFAVLATKESCYA
jgi:hypothetical protein